MNAITEKNDLVITRIRKRRETLNYTQAYVASKLNISQNAYSKIETGITSFSVTRLYQIADILQTDVRLLLLQSD